MCLLNVALQLCLQISKFLLERRCCCLCAYMSTCHCTWHTRCNPVSSASTQLLLNSGWGLCLEGFRIKVSCQGVLNKRHVQDQSNRNPTKDVFSFSCSSCWSPLSLGLPTLLTKFVALIVVFLSIFVKTACYFGITSVASVLWRFLIPKGAASLCVHNLNWSRDFVFPRDFYRLSDV